MPQQQVVATAIYLEVAAIDRSLTNKAQVPSSGNKLSPFGKALPTNNMPGICNHDPTADY